jgi:hypothetical protein
MRKILSTTLSIGILALIVSVSVVSAQVSTPTPSPSNNAFNVVPCGGSGQPECNLALFVVMIGNIINVIIALSIPATMLVFAWLGVLLLISQGDISKINRAKGIAWNVMVGFIVILSAWLLVNVLYLAVTGKGFNDYFK